MKSRLVIQTAMVLLLCLLTAAPLLSADGADAELEYKVKAGFLLNFVKFMSWPDTAFSGHDAPLVIGVFGENPFGGALAAAESKVVGGRAIKLIEVAKPLEAEQCQLLYISRSAEAEFVNLLALLRDRPMVTVSDIEGFAAAGGMVEFKPVDGRLGFIINNSQAKKSGIDVQAALLSLAVEVL